MLGKLDIKDRHRQGIVAARVTLLTHLNQRQEASTVLREAVEWHRNNKVNICYHTIIYIVVIVAIGALVMVVDVQDTGDGERQRLMPFSGDHHRRRVCLFQTSALFDKLFSSSRHQLSSLVNCGERPRTSTYVAESQPQLLPHCWPFTVSTPQMLPPWHSLSLPMLRSVSLTTYSSRIV